MTAPTPTPACPRADCPYAGHPYPAPRSEPEPPEPPADPAARLRSEMAALRAAHRLRHAGT